MKPIHLILLLFLFFQTSFIYAIENPFGIFVINHDRSEYQAMSQNWAVAFDDLGRAYFGNSGGVLEYNGKDWVLHQHRSKSAIRSLLFDEESNRLYSGCYEDFGYWDRDSLGVLNYHSLGEHLKDYHFSSERIWSIVKSGKEILFQSFPTLFTYNTETEEVRTVAPKGELMFLGMVNDTVYSRVRGSGICRIEDGKITVVDDSDFAKEATIRFYLPNKRGIIVGDGKTGLYILKDGKTEKWNCEANEVLSSKDVNSAISIGDSAYAIGTLLGGLYIINHDGKILSHIDRQSKLENNTVLGMAFDHSGDLWLGMDNGLSYVDLNSTIEYKIDMDNAPSAIYSVIKYKGYIYVGTNNGVLYSKFDKDYAELDFRELSLVEGITGHIWKLEILRGELLCGSNNGIFKLDQGNSYPLSTAIGGTDFEIIENNGQEWLIESTYFKIRMFKRVNGQWAFSHFVDGFEGSCRFIEVDHAGYIWISHEIKGLNRLKLSEDYKKVVSNKYFGLESGLPTEYQLNVFTVNNRVVVTTGEEIYTYDDLTDRMLPFDKLNNTLGRFKKAVIIVNADQNHFWAIADNEAVYMSNVADSMTFVRAFTLDKQFSFPDKYQNISINKDASVLCLENGFAILPNEENDVYQHQPLVITKVVYGKKGVDSKGILLPLQNENLLELNNRDNSLEFTINSVNYGPNNVTYQYRIVNLYDDWMEGETENVNIINDIPHGEYIYQARAVFSDGNRSNIVEYPFVILPPWFASKTGVVVIILSLVIGVGLLIVFNKRLLDKQTHIIEQKHTDQHKKYESTIEQLQNDVLQKELENLQGKLTVSANALVEKDRSINTIKRELEIMFQKLEGRFPNRYYDKILKVINGQLTQKKDMLDFERYFAASQSGFYDELRQNYPNLTPADLRLCSLLKMNMNSKEISILLGITVRSVEVSRYRLRKKLELEPEENLTKVIMKF
jgi:hypothetical protein